MAKELFSSTSDKARLDQAIRSAASTSGSLRIADEYQAWKGRGKLDALLRRAIPDNDFNPGPLHNLALRLPWSDILTTNFDTLLERAAVDQVDRSFSVVRSQFDIPGAQKPRIVKLHGSFPDSRPFVITEDDFRTYERKHPAMVNLVQQCFVESTCCLIGFSGDDPNFLRWTGWVRDVLGPSHMEPIYLVGLFDHSPARRALLEVRHVRSIDLAPLFPTVDWPDTAKRHQAGIEWFLRALMNLRPYDYGQWPDAPGQTPNISSYSGSPELPLSENENLRSEHWHPTDLELPSDNDGASNQTSDYEELSEEQKIVEVMRRSETIEARGTGSLLHSRIDHMVRIWTHNRERYPGWLVLPWRNRNSLELNTAGWVIPIASSLSEVEKSRGLTWICQLQWRLERCLLSWPQVLIEAVVELLDLNRSSETNGDFHWSNEIAAVSVQLLRAYREQGQQDEFDRLSELIAGKIDRTSEVASFYTHQKALAYLETWQVEKAEAVLTGWNVDNVDPIWRARKAALMGELNNDQAANEAFLALKEIQAIKGRNLITARSREAEIVWLASVLMSWRSDHRRDLDERRFHLRERGFGSASTRERLFSMVAAEPRGASDKASRRKIDEPSAIDCAFMLRRYAEETASLLRKPGISALGSSISAAVPWMALEKPIAALRLSVRNRERDSKRKLLNLSWLAQVAPTDLQPILAGILATIEIQGGRLHRYAGEEQYQSVFADDEHTPAEAANWLLKCAITHLRDLSPVLSEAQLKGAIEAIFQLRRNWKNGQWQTWDEIEETLGVLLSDCDDQTIAGLLSAIIEQPIVGFDTEDSSPIKKQDVIARPSMRIPFKTSLVRGKLPEKRLGELFEGINRDIELSVRVRIAMRLTAVWHLGALSKRQANQLIRAVENLRRAALSGSSNTTFDPAFDAQDLLLLPPGQQGQTRAKLVEWIATTQWSPQIARKPDGSMQSITMGVGRDDPMFLAAVLTREPWVRESWLLSDNDWDDESVQRLLEHASTWIDQEGLELIERQQRERPFFGRADERAYRIVEFCRKVVLPRSMRHAEIADTSIDILSRLHSRGLVTLSTTAVIIARKGEVAIEEVATEMRKAATSLEPSKALAFMLGLLAWISMSDRLRMKPPPTDLVREIANVVRARRAPDLCWALQIAGVLLRQYPDFVDADFRRDLVLGLTYLAVETDVQTPTLDTSQQQNSLEEIREECVKLLSALITFPEGEEIAKIWLEKLDHETVRAIRAEFEVLRGY